MKVLFLADHHSIHTRKWLYSLAERGVEIAVFGLIAGGEHYYEKYPGIRVFSAGLNREVFTSSLSGKWKYLSYVSQVKKLIKSERPDLVHAHYATSYGLLAAMSGFRPILISVWGSDVYDFPNHWLKKALLKFILNKADKVLSTSQVMADITSAYTKRPIYVTPFGIDMEKFRPARSRKLFNEEDFVIGTIKTLEEKYGISYLIRAFSRLREEFPDRPMKLLVVGEGSQEQALKELVSQLGMSKDVVFKGKIEHEQVPNYLNEMDVYAALSTLDSESFGVAIVEASSCELPVVVSNVGGLPEVVDDGITGLVVPKKDVRAAYLALKSLVKDSELRIRLGKKGRQRVELNYEWGMCLDVMTDIYKGTVRT